MLNGFPFDVRHDVIEETVGFAGVVQREDVRVLELGSDLDLAEEPFRAKGGGQLGPQYLDRHLAMVFQILGEVHRRHAAGTHLFLDGVAVG